MDLDLHLHSSASDGALAPAALVAAAAKAGLNAIALTDHDTVAGVPEALGAARRLPLEVIPALEASTTWDEEDLHILGYFVDPADPELVDHSRRAGERREERMRTMIDRLRAQGVEVDAARVRAAASDHGNLGRPHLARALVEAGYVASVSEAFDRFIGNRHPAYVPTRLHSPPEAIRMIRMAGGVAVWAHPFLPAVPRLLPRLREAGLQGVEVYRPRNRDEEVAILERAAREEGLLVTGGSDWHGPDDGPLGSFRVPASKIARFLEGRGLSPDASRH